MYFCVLFGKLHGIGEGPLMYSNFAIGGAHEDGSYLIDNKYFGNIIRVGPHDSKLLCSSFPIKLGDRFWIGYGHDVKDAIECGGDAFVVFIPDLKYFAALAGHYHCAAVGEHALEKHIFLEE